MEQDVQEDRDAEQNVARLLAAKTFARHILVKRKLDDFDTDVSRDGLSCVIPG